MIIIPSDRRSEDSHQKLIRSDRQSEAVLWYFQIVTYTLITQGWSYWSI